MSTRSRWFVLIVVALVVAGAVAAYVFRDRLNIEGDEPYTFAGSSDKLERTVVVPTLDTPIPEHKSAVWCLSFQVAWNRMKDFEKEPLQLEGADDVCRRLNESSSSTDDMTGDMYYATAGLLQDGTRERIRRVMAERFPTVQVPPLPDEGLIAFCYLTAELRYPLAYDDVPNALVFADPERDRIPVHAHGIYKSKESRELRDQPGVLFQDTDENDALRWFALDLCKASASYQLVAAKIPRKSTLAEMLADVDNRIEQFKDQHAAVQPGAILLVPNMHWRINHHLRELEGRRSTNKATAGQRMMIAFQMIDFKIDRRGAAVKSMAVAYKDKGGGKGPRTYDFRFDTSYLLYMKKRGAERPFLAMWIDNAELLAR